MFRTILKHTQKGLLGGETEEICSKVVPTVSKPGNIPFDNKPDSGFSSEHSFCTDARVILIGEC